LSRGPDRAFSFWRTALLVLTTEALVVAALWLVGVHFSR
jgi:hypothetical protein